MCYELFSIGPVTIYGYGLMIALGVLAALLTASYRAKKAGLSTDMIFNLTILCVLGGFLGAKILYIITEWKSLAESKHFLEDLSNGFVVYGGIIAGILTAVIYCRHKKVSALEYIDLAIPSVAIAQGLGRVGCFMSGCCYGRETEAWFGVAFNDSPFAPLGVKLIPTQLFSSIGDLLIAAVLILWARKKPKRGMITSGYLLLYGIGRFLIEFLRNDPRGNVGALSTSQFISIFMVAAGAVMMYFSSKGKFGTAKSAKDDADKVK